MAWSKLLYLRDLGDTEIGGFGIASKNDLLLVEDMVLVKQTCSAAFVSFDDNSVADFFDDQIDRGRVPSQFARIWMHTHPGNSPDPSWTDEDTFTDVFGPADWAVMFIIARGGRSYARLRFNVGPRGEMKIPVEVDYCQEFGPSDKRAWREEYDDNVGFYRSQLAITQGPLYQTQGPTHASSYTEMWNESNRRQDLSLIDMEPMPDYTPPSPQPLSVGGHELSEDEIEAVCEWENCTREYLEQLTPEALEELIEEIYDYDDYRR